MFHSTQLQLLVFKMVLSPLTKLYLGWFTLLLSWLLTTAPAPAAELPTLTVEELRDRFTAIQTQTSPETVDLQGFVIDLQNPDLRQAFTTEIRSHFTLAHPNRRLNISHSVIQGDWPTAALSTPIRLVPELLQTQLTPTEWQHLQAHPDLLTTVSLTAETEELESGHGADFANLPTWNLLRLNLRCEQTQFLGKFDSAHSLILQPWQAQGATFWSEFQANQSIWLADLDFSGVRFAQMPQFEQSRFWGASHWQQSHFEQGAAFAFSQFEQTPDFSQTTFDGVANWRGSQWPAGGNWNQSQWRDRALWNYSQVGGVLDLSEAVFKQTAAWRDTQFGPKGQLNLDQATFMAQLDLSNSHFAPAASLRANGLVFGSPQAQILGDRGQVGSIIQLSTLEGNETTLANLIRNFRRQEQVADANRLDLLRERLRLRQVQQHLRGTPWWQWAQEPDTVLAGLGMGLLLSLSEYGTNVGLVLLVGVVGVTIFALLFWLLDRGLRPPEHQTLPRWEWGVMLGSSGGLVAIATLALWYVAPTPLSTILGWSLWVIPLPVWIVWRFCQTPQPDRTTYLVEEGTLRQFRLLIIRLPIMPKYPLFRERYVPILGDRRWSWLNYYDFSLNNLFKFGFNDLRLRDKAVPGWVSFLVWYEWALGIGYIALLLWTLARTIPGLNLLIYLS
ncbi:MAG: hypothetical protein F6J87_09105 [Spirulina sp. SIO3F2]|nr:hypothetical protein [Spirulina sp. SIO3F2]